MKTQDLSLRMKEALAKAGTDWAIIPFGNGFGCTNSTLSALENRGLVETRLKPDQSIVPGWMKWEWRLTPEVANG